MEAKLFIFFVIAVVCVLGTNSKKTHKKKGNEAKRKAENTNQIKKKEKVQPAYQQDIANESEQSIVDDVLGYAAAYTAIRGVQKQLAKIPPKVKNGIVDAFDEFTVTIKPICEKCGYVSEQKITTWVGHGKKVEGVYDCKKCGKHMRYSIDRS